MQYRYYKNPDGAIHAYDLDDPTQKPYLQIAIDEKWEDVTGTWPPADWPPKENITNA